MRKTKTIRNGKALTNLLNNIQICILCKCVYCNDHLHSKYCNFLRV